MNERLPRGIWLEETTNRRRYRVRVYRRERVVHLSYHPTLKAAIAALAAAHAEQDRIRRMEKIANTRTARGALQAMADNLI